MRVFIVPVAIIVALIALFVVIDRKEFSRHNDVQTVQSESTTTKKKPTASVSETTPTIELKPAGENKPVPETKPIVETKPSKPATEAKPVAETKSKTDVKPAETKPVAETKPTEAKPTEIKNVETKPAETKSAAEAKHGKTSGPTAVPVATTEEAMKLNEEAMEYEKARKRKNDKTILEGKVLTISECPNPMDIDYPDCNLTITVVLNDSKNSTIILVVPCIRQSKVVITPQIEKDSLVAFNLIEESTLSEQEKSIQISDDNPDFDLDYCYADNIELIPYYSKITVYRKKDVNDIVYDTKLPLTENDLTIRAEYIKSELDRVSKIVSDYSVEDGDEFYNNFLKLTEGIGDDNHPYVEIVRDNGLKKLFPVEVNVTPKQFLNGAFLDPSDRVYHNARMIASVNDYLKERGILLIVVPYPQHFEAFADRFNLSRKLSTYNIDKYRYIQFLLQMDVEVLDLEPVFEKELTSNKYFHLLFEKNLHPTEMGAYYLSLYLYDHLSKYEFCDKLQRNDYSAQIQFTKYSKKYYGEEIDDLETVVLKNAPNPINKESPYVLVGDSFSISSHIQNYIANAFKTKINVVNATSSFTNTPRLIQMRNRELSANTKVLFLVNSSYALGDGKVKPFLNDDIVVYPNDVILPNKDFHLVGKDLEEKISIEFDLDISNLVVGNNKYKLAFYISSTNRQFYELRINSFPLQRIGTARTGHGIIEYSLPEATTPLHVELSTVPDEGYPICNGENLTLQIEKILLIEE